MPQPTKVVPLGGMSGKWGVFGGQEGLPRPPPHPPGDPSSRAFILEPDLPNKLRLAGVSADSPQQLLAMSQMNNEPLGDTFLLGVDKPGVGDEGGTCGFKTIDPNLVGLPAPYGIFHI